MKKSNLFSSCKVLVTFFLIAFTLAPILLSSHPWPNEGRDYLFENASNETGASNSVSAIYLGYRAMDTLGETLVLLVSITGTMTILVGLVKKEKSDSPNTFLLTRDKRKSNQLRTHLLEVVSGKLGPIVLLFGFYVMLYGHISPGGGFQGGVILASGIVFLALGNQSEKETKLNNPIVLARIEGFSFLALILASTSGMLMGKGFFGNPLSHISANFIILLNIIIGLKVGTSIASMCIAMMGRSHDD
ncbi:MAG: MnhB domain-containing protein [Sphaerochaeta sp.]|nr:MnhB domain-containing protein [Sphaerochaeta sp.]